MLGARKGYLPRPVAFAAVLAACLPLTSAPALAGAAWDDIRAAVFADRPIADGQGIVWLKAPYRPEDQRAVPIGVDAAFADGRTVKTVTLIIDHNPMPVAAVFHFGAGRDRVALATKLRLNQESDVRAIVESNDGALYMVASLVKFAGGQAACAAPPSGDPVEVAANMGKMEMTEVAPGTAATLINHQVRLDIRHPNHTGMQMDQITLLYIPLRMVSRLEVRQGDEPVFEMDGSIALAENPQLDFDFKPNGAGNLKVLLKDSENTLWERTFPLRPGS